MKHEKEFIIFISISLLFMLDMFSKFLLPNTYLNTGASFNLLDGYNTLLIIIGFITIWILLFLFHELMSISLTGWFLLFYGTFSNTLDRLINGGVTDYINMIFFHNNIADFMLFFGVIFYIYAIITKKEVDSIEHN